MRTRSIVYGGLYLAVNAAASGRPSRETHVVTRATSNTIKTGIGDPWHSLGDAWKSIQYFVVCLRLAQLIQAELIDILPEPPLLGELLVQALHWRLFALRQCWSTAIVWNSSGPEPKPHWHEQHRRDRPAPTAYRWVPELAYCAKLLD